ncbi:effector binding domain-containing protein [Paenibacillus sp. D51F]
MLTIRQMAGIFDVSAKTLRHYDSIGLFSPLAVGEDNRYRYYGFEQLGMLRRIMWLRSLGVGLETIQSLKDSGELHGDESLEPLLSQRETAIRGQMEELGKLLNKVEAMRERLQQSRNLRDGPRIVVKDAFTVVGLDWDDRQLAEGDGIPQLWERFLRRAHEIAGRVNPNELIGAGGPRESGVFGYIAGFETTDAGAVPQGLTAVTIPAYTYAVFELEDLGKIWEMREAIYSKLLPGLGLSPANGVMYEKYDDRFGGADGRIELMIPLLAAGEEKAGAE